MVRQLSRLSLGILALFLTVASVLIPGVLAGEWNTAGQLSQFSNADQGTIPTTNAAGKSNEYTITLITGDVLIVTPQANGAFAAEVRAAPRPDGKAVFQTITDSNGEKFVIPSDVRSLLPDILDPLFFNVNYLIANHLTDDQTQYLRAIVQYSNTKPVLGLWASSSVKANELSSIHSQALSIQKKDAIEFGKILRDPNLARSLPGVQKIWLDRVFTASDDQSGPLIGADITRNVLGYNGSGIKIAVVDTGIDNTHPDFFFPNHTSKIIINADYECAGQAYDPNQCDGTTNDLFGHGTHVASIAAGTGAASAGKYVGIAPGASLMNVKVLNRYGYGFDSWIIAGMQAAANGISGTKADIISMSLGDGSTDGTDPMSQAVNSLSASTGVTFVIAAGNAGSGSRTVVAPGAATAAITVAASTKVDPVSIAYFSSRGPRTGDYNVKPDITAPGVSIIAACSSTATYLVCPAGSSYLTLSGTSMATPHVAGSAALLIQAARKAGIVLTPAQVKNILQSSSRILQPAVGQPDVDIYQQGAGLVRIDRAIKSNVTFTPAGISFGLVPFDTTSSLRGTFQVTNRGLASQTLTLNWTMFDVPGNLSPSSTGSSYTNLVSLDKTSVTLAPSGVANVTMTINAAAAPYQKLWTFFSGRVTATSATGEQEHAIFGFTKEGIRQTLNITAILPDGTPAAGQFFHIVDGKDGTGFKAFFASLNSNGQAILRIPQSTYTLVMDLLLTPPKYSFYRFYRISNFNVVVQNTPVTAILDARTAGPVSLNLLANPSATAGIQQDDVFAYNIPNLSWENAVTIINGNWDLMAENSASAQYGTLWTQTRWERATNPYVNSTVLYDMAITRQQFGPAVDTVTSSNLTTTTGINRAKFHSDFATTFQVARLAFPAKFYDLGFALYSFYPINAPLVQTQYQQAGESLIRQMVIPGPGFFWFDTTYKVNYVGSGIILPGKIWTAGESKVESWLEQPLHPTLVTASRTGNTLSLAGYEITDTYGHPGVHISDRGANFTLSVYINNVLNFTSTSFPCPPSFLPLFPRYPCTPYTISLPSGTATVKIQMLLTPHPSWSKLAKTSTTTITFTTSSNAQGSIPNSNYIISGLNMLNQVPATGNSTRVSVTIPLTSPTGALFNATSGTVQYSTNDGASWNDAGATISPGLITIDRFVPTTSATTNLSLLLHAQSASAVTLDQSMIRAIRIVQGAAPSPDQDFSISASPTSIIINKRDSFSSIAISLQSLNGFSGTVALTGSPSFDDPTVGPIFWFSPANVTLTANGLGNSTMSFFVCNTTPNRTTTFTITGTSGTLSHSVDVTVTVTGYSRSRCPL